MILQTFHRGIYEYLWFEHKYAIIGISLKAFQGMATRMSKRPQPLQFLRKLGVYSHTEKPEFYNSLLHSYMHLKPHITRVQQFEIIKTLLEDPQKTAEIIFTHVLRVEEKALYGCRVFFPENRGIYKLWDTQDRPGLWLCFGPFQLHIPTPVVISRICRSTDTTLQEMQQLLETLRNGISRKDYCSLAPEISESLENNNMVATPGNIAFLHPRVCPITEVSADDSIAMTVFHHAALTLEKLWDNAEENFLTGDLPEFSLFKEEFQKTAEFFGGEARRFSVEEAYDFLATVFWQQQMTENGYKRKKNAESDSGIGMQTADEEVDSEESEHGDDEAYY